MYEDFFYIWIRYGKTNGNDVYFLNNSYPFGEKIIDNNLDKAAIFSKEEALNICRNNDKYSMILVQHAQRVATLHVAVSKLKKESLQTGEPCLLLSKRDTCGKNASFWVVSGKGYSSDVRCAQIFSYSEDKERSNRNFEYFVKAQKALKLAEKRVDVQDIADAENRYSHHSLSHTFKILQDIKKERESESTDDTNQNTEK